MGFVVLVLVVCATFGVCWLVDKGFTKTFRSAPQHASGRSVRINRHVGGIGTVVIVLGIFGVLAGVTHGWVVICAGVVLILTGAALVIYYLTFGVYYDDDGFVLSGFGKADVTYSYKDIMAQQLYITSGKTLVELHLSDGRTVQLQQGMDGMYEFLDKAFACWLIQKGLKKEDCDFFDPENSCWFPPLED